MKVFGDLAIDPSAVLSVAVRPTDTNESHAGLQEIGEILMHDQPRFRVSADSARKLINHFALPKPEDAGAVTFRPAAPTVEAFDDHLLLDPSLVVGVVLGDDRVKGVRFHTQILLRSGQTLSVTDEQAHAVLARLALSLPRTAKCDQPPKAE